MVVDKRFSFRKIMKLKTICVGETFSLPLEAAASEGHFPFNVLCHSSDFQFSTISQFTAALTAVRSDQEIDLVFIDVDEFPLTSVTMFVTQLREIRPRLPLIVFSNHADDAMR